MLTPVDGIVTRNSHEGVGYIGTGVEDDWYDRQQLLHGRQPAGWN